MELKDIVKGTYEIVDGLVNVEGDVNLYNKDLTSIPFKFGTVTGNFDCSANQLTNLKGSPETVGEWFCCSDNLLINLNGCPEDIGGDFIYNLNPISKKIDKAGGWKNYRGWEKLQNITKNNLS